jgi:hypothetical protein
MHIGDVLNTEIDKIKEEFDKPNKQILALAQVIDDSILSNYKLFTNYIAYDILNNSNEYSFIQR